MGGWQALCPPKHQTLGGGHESRCCPAHTWAKVSISTRCHSISPLLLSPESVHQFRKWHQWPVEWNWPHGHRAPSGPTKASQRLRRPCSVLRKRARIHLLNWCKRMTLEYFNKSQKCGILSNTWKEKIKLCPSMLNEIRWNNKGKNPGRGQSQRPFVPQAKHWPQVIQICWLSSLACAKRCFCMVYTMTSDFLVAQNEWKHYILAVLAVIYKVQRKFLDRYWSVFNY